MAHFNILCVFSLLLAVVSVRSATEKSVTENPLKELLEEWRNKDKTQDPCDRLWCMNGGTCDSLGDVAWCNCLYGYEGTSCEIRDESLTCYSLYCYNGGKCTRILDIEYCTCPRGYAGERCENRAYSTDWGNPADTAANQPDLNNIWKELDLLTDSPPAVDIWDFDSEDDTDYIDTGSIGWIAPLTIVGIIILGALYGTLLHVVRHRRRRLVLVRTVQGVTETATHPQRLMAGLIPVPYPNHNAIYVQRFAPQPPGGVCVPPQFESDQSQLLSTSDNNDVNGEHSMQSTTSPMVVTTGAPPPYAEVAPEEGGQSMDEPPPPYQDHER